MSLESVNHLSELTGIDRRTIKKRLADLVPLQEGRSHLYESSESLPLLYGASYSEDQYDLTEERARLAHHQANNENLKELENKGELVAAAEVVLVWQQKIAAARAQLLSLPSKAAPMVVSCDGQIAVESLIRQLIYEALNELSGSGLPHDMEQRLESIQRGLDAPS